MLHSVTSSVHALRFKWRVFSENSRLAKFLNICPVLYLVSWFAESSPPSFQIKKVPKTQVSSLYVPGVLSVTLQNLDFLLNCSTGSGWSELKHNGLREIVKEVQEIRCKDYRIRWLKIVWGFKTSGNSHFSRSTSFPIRKVGALSLLHFTAPLHGVQLCDSAEMFLCVHPEPHPWAALGMGNMPQVLKSNCHVWEESGIMFFKKSGFHMAVLTKVCASPVLWRVEGNLKFWAFSWVRNSGIDNGILIQPVCTRIL